MISPLRLTEYIGGHLGTTEAVMVAYWVRVIDGDRQAFADEVQRHAVSLPVCAVVPRGSTLFVSANALHDDIRRTLESCRQRFMDACDGKAGPLALVLVMRTDCAIAQVSSPVSMPDWFPRSPGQIAYVPLVDAMRRVNLALDSDEAGAAAIAVALYRLECQLVATLRRRAGAAPGEVTALFSELATAANKKSSGGVPAETWVDVLDKAQAYLDAVEDAEAFRPSIRDGLALVARLQALVARNSLDGMSRLGKILAEGLGIGDADPAPLEALSAVAFRPLSRDASEPARVGRAILLVVYPALQLCTASHHAGDYSRYSAVLLASVSRDLARSLSAIVDALQGHEALELRPA